jgi:cytochrome c556
MNRFPLAVAAVVTLATSAVFVLVAACVRETPPAPPPPPPPPPPASEVLLQLDTRAPVPLIPMMANHQKQNMREHLIAVQEIVAALPTDDFAAIEKAAGRIGFSEQMGQMCTHMGAGAPGFTEQALNFHHTADRIGAAAREHDRAKVVLELGATLKTCTDCHEKWKQQVVDDATFQRLTAQVAPTPDMQHH